MLRDQAEAGAFEAVWCLSPDRLARAYVYQVLVLDELDQFGVRVICSDAAAIDDAPQRRLLTQVQGVIAEYERARIAERTRRGRLYRSRAGEGVSWKAPYGYRRLARDAAGPARLEIFEPEAVVVRRIFEDYVNGGLSIRRIVRGLNTDQVPTPAGKAEWWHSTVCRVLRNEAYVGRLYFNQTETVPRAGPGSRRATRQRRRPREEWITLACPAIIDEAMFDAAQRVGRDNSKWSPRRLPEDVEAWLLRRLVRCGACDVAVGCQKIVSPQGKVHRYSWCPNHASTRLGERGRCPERNIRADALDDFVFEQVRSVLLRPDVLLAGQSALTAAAPAPDDDMLQAELTRMERKVEANRAERRRLADLYQSGLLELPEVQRRARDIDARHQSLTDQRDALVAQRRELATDNRLRQRVGDFAARATAGIDKLNFAQRQQLMRLVVDHIRVTGWQVEIQLRIPLDDPGGGGGGRRPPDDGSHTPGRRTRGSLRRAGSDPMSSEDGLRSLRGADMPQVGGQDADALVDAHPELLPSDQAVHSKAVSQVMYPRVHRGGAGAHGGRDLPERLAHATAGKGGAGTGDEERSRCRPRAQMVTLGGVVAQRPGGGGV